METKKQVMAKVKTQSNYENLNDTYIKVLSFHNSFLYCEFKTQTNFTKRGDFQISEIIALKEVII